MLPVHSHHMHESFQKASSDERQQCIDRELAGAFSPLLLLGQYPKHYACSLQADGLSDACERHAALRQMWGLEERNSLRLQDARGSALEAEALALYHAHAAGRMDSSIVTSDMQQVASCILLVCCQDVQNIGNLRFCSADGMDGGAMLKGQHVKSQHCIATA